MTWDVFVSNERARFRFLWLPIPIPEKQVAMHGGQNPRGSTSFYYVVGRYVVGKPLHWSSVLYIATCRRGRRSAICPGVSLSTCELLVQHLQHFTASHCVTDARDATLLFLSWEKICVTEAVLFICLNCIWRSSILSTSRRIPVLGELVVSRAIRSRCGRGGNGGGSGLSRSS
jgi:hypothetical protein